MIVTLSPAKLMDFSTPAVTNKKSGILYPKEADYLMGELDNFPAEEIGKLMSVNPKLSVEVYQYIKAFHLGRTPQKQAMFTYNGMAYHGLAAVSFSEKDMDYAQEHLIILSGLYGAVRPLDMIKPYRLEMQTPLENDKGNTLYDFWTEKLTAYLSKRLKEDDNIWINLMSNEYTKAIDKKRLPKDIQLITPVFKQQTAKGYKQIVIYTKKARGMMTRFILKNRLTDVEHLKAFDEEGYSFSSELSNPKEWVFVR